MSRFSFLSLRFRLILLVLLAVIPALGLMLYSASEDRQREASHIEADVLRLARIASIEEEQLIGGTRQLLIALAQLPEVRSGDSVACSALCADLLKQYHRYGNFGAIKPDGDVFCSGLPISGAVTAADRAYFQRALQMRDFAIGDYQIGRITGKASINFGYPVFGEDGQVQAVVFAALDLDWLNRLEFEVEAQLPQGSTLTKIDRKGIVLTHQPDPEKWVGQSVLETTLVQTVLAQGQGVVKAIGLDGTRGVYAFAPMPSALYASDVHVVIGVPEEVVFAEVNRTLARNLALLGIVAVLALVAAWVGGDVFILRWVNALLRAAERLSAGDLSARTGPPYGQGELSELARTFDQMAEALEQREAERKRAEEELRQSFEKLQRTLKGTVHTLAITTERRDPYTAGHQRRVTDLACAIAKEMGLPKEQIEGLRMAGLIHDLGKISVPAEILNKPGRLGDLEYGLIQAHPQVGYDILKEIEFPWPVAQIVLQHHERMNGSGYPQGLSGEEIMLEARILAVADVVEAMASFRPYRPARSIDEALEEISQNKGVLYDPEVVDACLKLFAEKGFELE